MAYVMLMFFWKLGKGPSLYRHELLSLHNRQNHRFSHTMDKIPVKLVPR